MLLKPIYIDYYVGNDSSISLKNCVLIEMRWNVLNEMEKKMEKKTIECHKNVYFHFLNVLNLIFWKILCCLFWMMYVPTQRSCGSQEHSRTSSIFIFLLKNENKKKNTPRDRKGKKTTDTLTLNSISHRRYFN